MESLQNPLKNFDSVIFDLGGVIINLDLQLTLDAFAQHLSKIPESEFVGSREPAPFFSDYETGRISTADFMKAFQAHYRSEISEEAFIPAWNAMILDLPRERLEFLDRLRASGTRVFLLSNINALHEDFLMKRYSELGFSRSFQSFFDQVYFSHHLGLRKPDPAIFQRVVQDQGLDPARTCFIDDSLQHVESARRCGLHAIHWKGV